MKPVTIPLYLKFVYTSDSGLLDNGQVINLESDGIALTLEQTLLQRHGNKPWRLNVTATTCVQVSGLDWAIITATMKREVPTGVDLSKWSLGQGMPRAKVGDRVPDNMGIARSQLGERLSLKIKEAETRVLTLGERALRVLRWSFGRNHSARLNRDNVSTHDSMWSLDGSTWTRMPSADLLVSFTQIRPVTEDAKTQAVARVLGGEDEPVGITILAEAESLRYSNSRVSLVLAMAAAEVGLKVYLSNQFDPLEDLLMELPWPPLNKIVDKVLPKVRGVEALRLDPTIARALAKAIESRNKVVHRGVRPLDVYSALTAVARLLAQLEADAGFVSTRRRFHNLID